MFLLADGIQFYEPHLNEKVFIQRGIKNLVTSPCRLKGSQTPGNQLCMKLRTQLAEHDM